MPFYNASQAAKYIGISDKTIRRWLAQGRITATKTKTGQLAIAASEVERLRQEVEQERTQFVISGPTQASLDMARHSEDFEGLTERVENLEQRIASLETQMQTSLRVPTQPERASTTQNTSVPAKGPEIASTEARNSIPDELPSGVLSVRDFAKKIGMDYTMLDGYARRGIRGEKMDVTEVPHPTRKGYTNKYFSSEQQEKAFDMLKRHGKL